MIFDGPAIPVLPAFLVLDVWRPDSLERSVSDDDLSGDDDDETR
jgi:hypothetical protein